MGTLVIAEHDNAELKPATLSVVTAAKQLGSDVDILVVGSGCGPVGEVAGYSLMESTTDIAAELTDLIETQRAYSSNAKIVQTVDEMLQETTNLKR